MLSRSGNPREQAVSAAKWFTFLVSGLFLLFMSTMQLKDLMSPGPLSAKHGAIDQCKSCHSKFADNSYWWISAAFSAPHPATDSKRCIVCHSVGDTPLAAHNMSETMLTQITKRLQNNSEGEPKSLLSLAKFISPASLSKEGELFCATCHQEHSGTDADLQAISDKQCQTCHTLEFDSFQKGHPDFESFPQTSISAVRFDHKSHFTKHFAEVVKERKAAADDRSVPNKCTFCHQENAKTQSMAIKPFAETCHSCHINQILGKDRATGPEGIAFFAIPGMDQKTLSEKKIDIGEWPENSEVDPSPIMMQLLASREIDSSILNTIREMDLLDLSNANDDQINAVKIFAWEVKKLLSDLLWEKDTNINSLVSKIFQTELDRQTITGLTANIPHDVLLNAQQLWFPKLKRELSEASQEALKTKQKEVKKSKPPQIKKSVRVRPLQQRGNGNSSGSASWRVDPFGKLLKGDEPTESARSEISESETSSEQSDNTISQEKEQEEANENDDAEDVNSGDIFGGWYRRDYTIFYKPVGHADRFLRTWLELTMPNTSSAGNNFMSATFKTLSNPEAPGRCAKCHTLEKTPSGKPVTSESGSKVRSIFSVTDKSPGLTKFVHTPHLSPIEGKGCMSCHKLKNSPKKNNSRSSGRRIAKTPSFKFMEKSTCEKCHTTNKVRTDCLLCHNYHLNPVQVQLPADRLQQSN